MCIEQILPIPVRLLSPDAHVLLFGDSSTFKSSFLFQFCHTVLRQSPHSVAIYICAQSVTRLPVHVHQMANADKSSSARLQMIYLSTLDDLFNYVASLYRLDAQISAIVVDELHLLINRRRLGSKLEGSFNFNLGRLFALLLDTIHHLERQYLSTDQPIRLLMASGFDAHPVAFAAGLNTVGRQYFDQLYRLTKVQCVGSDRSAVELEEEELGIKIRVERRDSLLHLFQVSRRRSCRQRRRLLG